MYFSEIIIRKTLSYCSLSVTCRFILLVSEWIFIAPAYDVRRKGNVFSLSVSSLEGGGGVSRSLVPGHFQSQVLSRGYPLVLSLVLSKFMFQVLPVRGAVLWTGQGLPPLARIGGAAAQMVMVSNPNKRLWIHG